MSNIEYTLELLAALALDAAADADAYLKRWPGRPEWSVHDSAKAEAFAVAAGLVAQHNGKGCMLWERPKQERMAT